MGNDKVNHPDHYNTDGIECIDAMIATQGERSVINFCICNAFKYLWRHNDKNGVEDIEKASWYLDKAKELYRKIDDSAVNWINVMGDEDEQRAET